jgi:hypothetical protein
MSRISPIGNWFTRRRLGLFCLLVLTFGMPSAFASGTNEFKHPGILSTQADLEGLKGRVNTNPATKSGYEQLKRSPFADVARPHTPYAVVKVVASGSCEEEKAFRKDAHAAHATALMWVITGDSRYRDKAIVILNDWAAAYERIEANIPGRSAQTQLECAWAVPVWTAAADIIRYYDKGAAGWKPEQIAAFDRFLNRMLKTARDARDRNNNWGTSATLAIMAAAVYQNDEAAYAEAVTLHRKHLASISKPSGALGPDYLRDPWHPQYTILTWIQICELAWNQGDDLYGITLEDQSLPRLALCLEHFANLFLGNLPNPEGLQKGDYKNSHKNKQGYDMAFNHFINRKKLGASMPTFSTMVPAWRPGGLDDHFMAWDTLTHGELNTDKK